MRLHLSLAVLGGLLAATSAALAQPSASPYVGTHELTGQYSNRRHTAVTLEIELVSGGLRVTRTGRYTSWRHRDEPDFTWVSDTCQEGQSSLYATYRVPVGGGGLRGGLAGSAGSGDYNLLLAIYKLSADGREIEETVINTTREAPEDFYTRIRTRGPLGTAGPGPAVDAFRAAAEGQREALADLIMEFRTDVADSYEPGDEERYRQDARAAEAFFAGATFVEVAVPAELSAHKAFEARNASDPRGVVAPGQAYVLLDEQARVTERAYVSAGYVHTSSDGATRGSTPPTPTPGAACGPEAGITVAEAIRRAKSETERLTSFIMDFRANVAGYYGWGDDDYYAADAQAARSYFQTATWEEVPVPSGYAAHVAVRAHNADPADALLGSVTLLFDCDGEVVEIVYESDGSVYDTGDV